jgi:thioredoxin reductase (NADPH)
VVGGTITQSHNVQNWPGEVAISGIELGEKVQRQAEANGALLQSEIVVSVDFSKSPYLITTKKIIGSNEQLKRYKAQTVIIGLGATPHLLNVPGETNYWSKGVYSCAVCDGSLYKDKVVTVVGGGDSALIETQYLSNIASKVHLLVRRDEFRAGEKQRLKEILATPNVEVHYMTTVKEIKGDGDQVTHLVLQDAKARKTWELPTDALFLAIGSHPNTDLFKGQLELDEVGYIQLKKHQQTSLEGVYAIGDVADPEFKQAISAAGDAAKAAMQAQKFLASTGALSQKVQTLAAAEKKPEIRTVIEIRSRQQFEKEIREAHGAVFVDFYSTHCPPCRMFSPMYDDWAKEYGGKIKFLKVNADHVQELFMQFQVRGVPTLIILDEKGNIVRRSTGFNEISDVEKRLVKVRDNALISPQDFK